MTSLSGFGSLAAIPEEKITDKITRRVLAGQKGMMVVVEDRGRDTCGHAFTSARATRVGRQGQDGLPHR